MDRRSFLLAGGAVVAAGAPPGEQVHVGTIGCGGRGRYVMAAFAKDPAVRLAAVCDVYEPNLEAGLSAAGGQAKPYRNHRALLDDTAIDVVLIATPEHWHHRMLLDALAAGKDVYVEKPLCQTPEQGVELVDAVRRSDRIVQVGMQRRSYDLYLKARDIHAAGTLGTVRLVRSWWVNNNLHGRSQAALKGPLDWEQWQGPARRHPLDPDRFFNWRAYRDYSGGIVADQGAHVYDGIHLVRGVGFPMAVNASAGRVHNPGVDTPETVIVIAEYPEDFLAAFTINYAGMRYPTKLDQLNQYDGDHARMDLGRGFLAVYPQTQPEKPSISGTGSFDQATEAHVRNFLDCVRSRNQPNAPVEKGFQAALVVQLANRSLELARRVKWDAATRRVEA